MSRHEYIKIKIRGDQMVRLGLLQAALSEKMNKDMTISDLIEKIIDDFLGSK